VHTPCAWCALNPNQLLIMEDEMFTMDGEAETQPTESAQASNQDLEPCPGVPKAWVVNNIKDWVMTEIGTGTLKECRDAIEAAMMEADKGSAGRNKKDRPFFYVTMRGEPPELNLEPFTSMAVTAFPAYCDISGVASLTDLDGARAVEIRKAKQQPQGFRIRVLHDADTEINLDVLGDTLDFQSLYNMGYDLHPQPNHGGGSIAFTPDEAQQMRAAEASAKFCEKASAELAAALGEAGSGGGDIIKRAVMYAGNMFCNQILKQTQKIEEDGGILTSDGSRRRTPGGVFLKLLKEQIQDPQLKAVIFETPVQQDFNPNAIPINESAEEDVSPASSSLKADAMAFTPGGSAINIPGSTPPKSSSLAYTPPTSSSLPPDAAPFVPGK